MRKFVIRLLIAMPVAISATFMTGCKQKLIDKVTFGVNPNLETARVTLIFDQIIQSTMGGTFPVKKYGSAFVNPSTVDTPLSVGFELNLEIMNDNEYATYKPTTTLPTGQSIPGIIRRALAQVTLKKQINSEFDLYTYIDIPTTISHGEWLGVAVTINRVDNVYFPSGLMVSQDFLKDANGVARATALVFGPSVDENGNLKTPGGIALFANVRALIKGSQFMGEDTGFNSVLLFNGTLLSP